MHRVAILTYDGAALFELGCATELFALDRPEFDEWYECQIITFEHDVLRSTGGLQIVCDVVTQLDGFDTLVVPSWPSHRQDIPNQLAQAILAFYEQGHRIISFCSGSFLLAGLGILAGRKATTHWQYAETFKQRFPDVEYLDDVLYILDGQVGCSAGSAAAIDLGIEVIRHDFGYQVANKVARRMVLSAHRKGGQSQFAETPVPAHNNQFSQALDWAQRNLSMPIDVSLFAKQANMSRRTFDRKFRANLNMTPKAWLVHQRLQLAKRLLEQESCSIERVAELSGFDNASTMRHHFRKELGVSPSVLRQQFNPVAN